MAGAAALTVAVLLCGWRGADFPFHIYRTELFRQYGFTLWDNGWYGGHSTLNYSVISPALDALMGPLTVVALSGLLSVAVFTDITRRHFGNQALVGSIWFGVGTVADLVVGRVAFSLGLLLALLAVSAVQREHVRWAALFGLGAALASPIAGLVIAVAAAAWGLSDRHNRWSGAAIAAASLTPIAVMTVLFNDNGQFPYEIWALGWDLVVAATVFIAARRTHIAIRYGAALYALAAIGAYVIPTSLGGNISRVGQFVAGPVLACLIPRRRLLLAGLAAPLIAWQWIPALGELAFARTDPSSTRTYFSPMTDFVKSRSPLPGRVEVPFTRGHWEAAYVADQVMLARGWQRQLDIEFNPQFYDGFVLTADNYRAWLQDNAVEYVALPDAVLDASSSQEAALLRHGLPYLEPVWHNAHWQVWHVDGYLGLVHGPASVSAVTAASVTLHTMDTATSEPIDLKMRWSAHWHLDTAGCVQPDGNGWTRVRDVPPGSTVHLTQDWVGSPCE
jgi:hypothetical protein